MNVLTLRHLWHRSQFWLWPFAVSNVQRAVVDKNSGLFHHEDGDVVWALFHFCPLNQSFGGLF